MGLAGYRLDTAFEAGARRHDAGLLPLYAGQAASLLRHRTAGELMQALAAAVP
jgi:hypothetical protein